MSRYLLIPIVGFLFLGCSSDKTADIEQSGEASTAISSAYPDQLTDETVRIFGLTRPGGEAHEFDMKILKGHEAWDIVIPKNSDIQDDELVLGLLINGKPLAVPIRHMQGFEVSNLDIEDESYLLTWCPLVGSARVFSGDINGKEADFDFGMGLVKNNLTIVDRETNTVWGQLSCKTITGELADTELTPLASIQTTWAFWKERNPATKILINSDTSGAVFPQWVNQMPYYTSLIPGKDEYRPDQEHDISQLGLGISTDQASVFYKLNGLFGKESPVVTTVGEEKIRIYFNENGKTAWAETESGELLAGTIVYQWAWQNFYPDSSIF